MLDTGRAREHGWGEKDVLLAMALTVHEDGLCRGCGHPVEECTSPAADPDNRESTHTYLVGPPTRCHACTALAKAEDAHRNPGPDTRPAAHPGALHWFSTRQARTVR
jgi:hypothetical protein